MSEIVPRIQKIRRKLENVLLITTVSRNFAFRLFNLKESRNYLTIAPRDHQTPENKIHNASDS